MRRFIMGLLAAVLLSNGTAARAEDYFQQFVHYTISARLDTDAKRIGGHETIAYTNNSPDTLTFMHLHLYPNAYRDRHSPFMRDFRKRYNLNLFEAPKERRGNLDISNVTVDGAAVDVHVDYTLAFFELPKPLPPGATMEIALDFDGKVRRHTGRAGYSGDHYDFAQWYPKIVVYDENGFHADPFMTGEFYGEFGTFDVHLDVPGDAVIAATGLLQSGDPGWNYNPPPGSDETATVPPQGRKTVHFHAENVHDFAWCLDPKFVVESGKFGAVDLNVFYRKNKAKAWQDSVLVRTVRTMKWLNEKVGTYAYPQVSVVDALLGGGMEYPMLVMNGSDRESLIRHEVGHIYFYGILGNDERAEAWLDEGFTTFQTRWYEDVLYGAKGDRSKLNWYLRMTPQPTLWEDYRIRVFHLDRRGISERISTRSERFKHDYYDNVYRKAALMYNALRHLVGDETFTKIVRTYYERWQLKHVNEQRFAEVAKEVSGMDLDLFFEQWLHTRKVCDYRVADWHRGGDDGSSVEVTIERKGERTTPIDLVFTMKDGSTETRRVDGRLRTIVQTFELPGKPKRVAINPDNDIADINLADNFMPRRRSFQFDWPNNNHTAEWGYEIRYRPAFWYNRVDELKTGLHLRGSNQNWSRRIDLGVYYGTKSDRVDFSVRYDKPLGLFNKFSRFYINGYKMEGRVGANMWLSMRRRAEELRPPTQHIDIGYGYNRLADPRYLTSTETHDTSRTDVGFTIHYAVDPQVDVMSTNLDATLRLGRKWTAGDYHYERLATTLTMKTRREYVPMDLGVRLFAGLLGGDAPQQERFQLGGAGPLQTDSRFFLRSPDAVPVDFNYHEPGDGNLRGYRVGTFGVDKLVSANVELGTPLPVFFLGRLLDKFPGPISWYGFYDVGRIFDNQNPVRYSTRVQTLVDGGILDETLADAGIGFRSRAPLPFWNLFMRVDIPFYVNHPEVNDEPDKSDFRYLFSLSSSF